MEKLKLYLILYVILPCLIIGGKYGSLAQFVSGILALITIVTLFIKAASIAKMTNYEKILLTDYKRTQTFFVEFFTIVFIFSVFIAALYAIIFPESRIEETTAFFIVSVIYSAMLLWLIYQVVLYFKKTKTRYYVIDVDGIKLYVHKAISDSELILSPDTDLKEHTSNIQIKKRDFLYDKTIHKEII